MAFVPAGGRALAHPTKKKTNGERMKPSRVEAQLTPQKKNDQNRKKGKMGTKKE